MARQYDASNEERTELSSIEKNKRGDRVVTTMIENKVSGAVAYDIRQAYTDDNDEIKFTSKGIRIKEEDIVDILSSIAFTFRKEQLIDLVNDLESALSEK